MIAELTPEQQKILIDIRRKKTELLLEIQVSSARKLDGISFYFVVFELSSSRHRVSTVVVHEVT